MKEYKQTSVKSISTLHFFFFLRLSCRVFTFVFGMVCKHAIRNINWFLLRGCSRSWEFRCSKAGMQFSSILTLHYGERFETFPYSALRALFIECFNEIETGGRQPAAEGMLINSDAMLLSRRYKLIQSLFPVIEYFTWYDPQRYIAVWKPCMPIEQCQ